MVSPVHDSIEGGPMKSIRRELSIRLLVGVLVMLTVAGAVLASVIHHRLLAEFDAALLAKARALSALTSREGRGIEIDYSGEHLPEFEHNENPEYFEFALHDGSLIARSRHLGADQMPARSPVNDVPAFRDWLLPDGRPGRVVQLAFRPRVDPGEEEGDADGIDEGGLFPIPGGIAARDAVVVLTVARGREHLDEVLWSLYGTLALVTLTLLAAMAFWVRQVTTRALQPLADIDQQVSTIGADHLQERIRLVQPPQELRTIIDTLNNLLHRLQRAFERERRFSSDVAHELRTPVAELRTACDVGGAWPDDPVQVRQFFADIRDIAVQMETTVNNLLMLAGCESGQVSVATEPVPLDQLLQTSWERAAGAARARNVSCEFHVDHEVTVRTDRPKLELVLLNLLGNAASYAAAGSTVHCTIRNGGARVELAIENRVDDIKRDDLPHVFERFWRKDAARGSTGHCGLGLSIAKALCDLLAVDLRVELRDPDVFTARLSFAVAG